MSSKNRKDNTVQPIKADENAVMLVYAQIALTNGIISEEEFRRFCELCRK